MPPKAKFTKQQIIDAAFSIVKTRGEEALTARALGEELCSSARPVFTVFNGMEEVQSAVFAAAKKLYAQYVEEGLNEPLAFRGVGKAYIRFASDEPKLFALLFMREQPSVPNVFGVLNIIEEHYEAILKSIEDGYGFKRDVSEQIYRHLWLYSHGIAALTATKMCAFSAEDVENMLNDVGASIIRKYKSEGK